MSNRYWMAAAMGLALVAGTATAGGDHAKCTQTTQECLNAMVQDMKDRGWSGIELDKGEGAKAYTVKSVASGSPAEKAGIRTGDVVLAVNGIHIADESQHDALVKMKKERMRSGKTAAYTVVRDGKQKDVSLTLAPLPEEVMARWVGAHMLEHSAVEVAKK